MFRPYANVPVPRSAKSRGADSHVPRPAKSRGAAGHVPRSAKSRGAAGLWVVAEGPVFAAYP